MESRLEDRSVLGVMVKMMRAGVRGLGTVLVSRVSNIGVCVRNLGWRVGSAKK